MHKGRIEAFSDGVIAILITIMVLELRAPHGGSLAALEPLLPIFLSYVLSFIYIGIYWNNHHHLFQAVQHVKGSVLLANMHLLFWLSLIPFTTSWMSDSFFASIPVALYGGVLLFAGAAYYVLVRCLIRTHGVESHLSRAIGDDVKGKFSLVGYGTAIGLAFLKPGVAITIYVLIALVWLVPDRRIEKILER